VGRDANQVRKLIASENQRHMKSIDGQAHKTLTEEEILGELPGGKPKGNIL